MPNQYTVAKAPNHKTYKIEVVTSFPASYHNVSPENGRLWAEEGMGLAVKTANTDRKVIANWVLSKDQRRNMPPLSLFVETRSKPIVFAAFVLACAYDVYPDKVVGLKEIHNAYEAMHRTTMDSRCPRVAAWVLGCSLRVANNAATPKTDDAPRKTKRETKPVLTVVPPVEAEILEEFGTRGEAELEADPTDVSKMQEQIDFLTSAVNAMSEQMVAMVAVIRKLTEAAQAFKAAERTAPPSGANEGVTLAQLALVGMEIHLVPTYNQTTNGGAR